MIKVYKKLTEQQKKNNIIFSSCLSEFKTEQETDNKHEVKNSDKEKDEIIKRLLDDKFFNDSHWIYNIIRR